MREKKVLGISRNNAFLQSHFNSSVAFWKSLNPFSIHPWFLTVSLKSLQCSRASWVLDALGWSLLLIITFALLLSCLSRYQSSWAALNLLAVPANLSFCWNWSVKSVLLWRPRWSCWLSYISSRERSKNGEWCCRACKWYISPSHLSLHLTEWRQKNKFWGAWDTALSWRQVSHQIRRAMSFPQEKKKPSPKAIHCSSSLWSYIPASLLITPTFLILTLSFMAADGRFMLTSCLSEADVEHSLCVWNHLLFIIFNPLHSCPFQARPDSQWQGISRF